MRRNTRRAEAPARAARISSPNTDTALFELRRSLGYRCQNATFFLHCCDTYACQKNHTSPLTQEPALSFAMSNPNSSTNYRAHRYRVVRHFSEHLSIYDPKTRFLDPSA